MFLNTVKMGRAELPSCSPTSRAVRASAPFWDTMVSAAWMISSLVNFGFGGIADSSVSVLYVLNHAFLIHLFYPFYQSMSMGLYLLQPPPPARNAPSPKQVQQCQHTAPVQPGHLRFRQRLHTGLDVVFRQNRAVVVQSQLRILLCELKYIYNKDIHRFRVVNERQFYRLLSRAIVVSSIQRP